MRLHVSSTSRDMLLVGAAAAGVGGYFVLVGLSVLPIPGGPRNLHGPLWIVLIVGAAFFLAGLAALLQAVGGAKPDGELPPNAPSALRIAQYGIGVALFASFTAIGAWVALAGDARHFSGGVPLLDRATNVLLARVLFGVCAALTAAATVAYAIVGARKLFGNSATAKEPEATANNRRP